MMLVERCCIVGLGYVLFTVKSILDSYGVLDIVVDNCAICRNHIMDLCASSYLIPGILKLTRSYRH